MNMTHITKATTVATGTVQGMTALLVFKPGTHKLVRTMSAYIRVNGQETRINRNTAALARDDMDQFVSAAKQSCNLVVWN